MSETVERRSVWSMRCGALALLLAGFVAGHWHQAAAPVWGEVRATAPRKAFLSGGERAEATLKEIHRTLLKMDTRLENLERTAATIANRKPTP